MTNMMKYFDWDKEKNKKLKQDRGVSFEEIVIAIKENRVIKITNHPNRKCYPNQKIFILEIHNYAYLVPFVEDDQKVLFKTIIPNRQATKKYIRKEAKRK